METKEAILDDLNQMIDALKAIGLSVEVCGHWLWPKGDTRPLKQKLKELGCRWSHNKKCWYYKPRILPNRRYKEPWEMERIRQRHGSAMAAES